MRGRGEPVARSGFCLSVEVTSQKDDPKIADLFKLLLSNIGGCHQQAGWWYRGGARDDRELDKNWSVRSRPTGDTSRLIMVVYVSPRAMLESEARRRVENILALVPLSTMTFIPLDAADDTPIAVKDHPDVTFTKVIQTR